ncbi:hypothetical protein QFZ49_008066 [Streptomyces turgidiscabies]|uniref:Uncharacterized protein n=1 Tax=Streptomyces turgidiscabies TaxID=85558 RepID=A0ABU0S1J4_9ACTN|nr:hypothetical protein [Streptomyces turgidiscabies]
MGKDSFNHGHYCNNVYWHDKLPQRCSGESSGLRGSTVATLCDSSSATGSNGRGGP